MFLYPLTHTHRVMDGETDAHSTSVLLLLCSPVDKPGVLVLEVLEVLEECNMRLVRCEHHQSPQDDQTHSNPKSDERTHVMVLFGRETAVHLNPAPKDIIHIYPPWWENALHATLIDPQASLSQCRMIFELLWHWNTVFNLKYWVILKLNMWQ